MRSASASIAEFSSAQRSGFQISRRFTIAGDHACALEAGVLDQVLWQADAASRVERLVDRACVEAPLHAPALTRKRVQACEEALLEGRVGVDRVDLDTGIEPLRENNSIRHRRSESGRDRDAVLRVEAVLMLTAKRQFSENLSGLPSALPTLQSRKELGRGEEVGGASPPRPVELIGATR